MQELISMTQQKQQNISIMQKNHTITKHMVFLIKIDQ